MCRNQHHQCHTVVGPPCQLSVVVLQRRTKREWRRLRSLHSYNVLASGPGFMCETGNEVVQTATMVDGRKPKKNEPTKEARSKSDYVASFAFFVSPVAARLTMYCTVDVANSRRYEQRSRLRKLAKRRLLPYTRIGGWLVAPAVAATTTAAVTMAIASSALTEWRLAVLPPPPCRHLLYAALTVVGTHSLL